MARSDGPAPAWWLAALLGACAAQPPSVEVFYKVNCPHCADFLRSAVAPLVAARLPGAELRLHLSPVVQNPGSPEACLADGRCAEALAQVCALRATVPYAPADSPLWPSAVEFVACHLAHTATVEGAGPDDLAQCASAASLSEEELVACAAGGEEAFEALRASQTDAASQGAFDRLKSAGFANEEPMPWVFVGGDFYRCEGSGCYAVAHPSGDEPLEPPVTLLGLACQRLTSAPAACAAAASAAAPAAPPAGQTTVPCENCFEMVPIDWEAAGRTRFPRPGAWLAAAAAALLAAGAVGAARGSRAAALLGPEAGQSLE